MKKKKVKPGGICKLCNEPTKQFRKSHIFPEWLIRERTKTGNFFLISSDDVFKRHYPIGIYDFFLCSKCEEDSSQYDEYACTFFRSAKDWKITRIGKFTVRTVEFFDYKKLKLFMMNILFRAAAASQKFFEHVEIENADFERLRKMVEAHDPGSEEDFSVVISKRAEFMGLERIWELPQRFKDAEENCWYRFDLNEFPCDIKCNREPSTYLKSLIMKPIQPLNVFEAAVSTKRISDMFEQCNDRILRERQFRNERRIR